MSSKALFEADCQSGIRCRAIECPIRDHTGPGISFKGAIYGPALRRLQMRIELDLLASIDIWELRTRISVRSFGDRFPDAREMLPQVGKDRKFEHLGDARFEAGERTRNGAQALGRQTARCFGKRH